MRATTESVRTLKNFNLFREAFDRGERVAYRSADGSFEVQPLYGLDVPATSQLRAALNYTLSLLQASDSADRAGAREWIDELEVLAMHTDNPSIVKICEGVIGIAMSR